MAKSKIPDQVLQTLADTHAAILANTWKRLAFQWVNKETGERLYVYHGAASSFPIRCDARGHWMFQHSATQYEPGAEIPWHRFSKATAALLRAVVVGS